MQKMPIDSIINIHTATLKYSEYETISLFYEIVNKLQQDKASEWDFTYFFLIYVCIVI